MEEANRSQRAWFSAKIRAHFGGTLEGKRFALWGLSFKPHTDDMREAPSLDIIPFLLGEGAEVAAYDPVASNNARALLGERPGLSFGDDPYEVLEGADALVLLTEWPLFRRPDFERMKDLMKSPVVFDGRNQYSPKAMAEAGFACIGIGRGRDA